MPYIPCVAGRLKAAVLCQIAEGTVSMAAVITSIGSLTKQLEKLTEESKELPAHTKRYYGMYLLLVYCTDRIQTRFIQDIDDKHLPKLLLFEEEARRNMEEAQRIIGTGGPKTELEANVEAAKKTIEACRLFSMVLREQRDAIARENQNTKMMLATAANTYKTVRLSISVAELINDCQNAFQSLRQLKLPPLRLFQNLQLKQEMQHLTERLIATSS